MCDGLHRIGVTAELGDDERIHILWTLGPVQLELSYPEAATEDAELLEEIAHNIGALAEGFPRLIDSTAMEMEAAMLEVES